jgi:uncharacterized membrane protein YphA (DoxX/SURF4 family)
MQSSDWSALLTVVASCIGAMFLYSGLAKYFSLRSFVDSLRLIPYLPLRWVRFVAVSVPAVEIIAACGVLLGLSWAKLVVLALLAGFSIIAWVAHLRRQKVPCNCFGSDSTEYLSLRTVARNVTFGVLLLASDLFETAEPSYLSVLFGVIACLLALTIQQVRRNQLEMLDTTAGGNP